MRGVARVLLADCAALGVPGAPSKRITSNIMVRRRRFNVRPLRSPVKTGAFLSISAYFIGYHLTPGGRKGTRARVNLAPTLYEAACQAFGESIAGLSPHPWPVAQYASASEKAHHHPSARGRLMCGWEALHGRP